MKRKILVILSNRWDRNQKPRLLDLDCDAKGTILKQRRLSRVPAHLRFDEVWENDEGRTDFASCHKFRRKYVHKLLKPPPPARQTTRARSDPRRSCAMTSQPLRGAPVMAM